MMHAVMIVIPIDAANWGQSLARNRKPFDGERTCHTRQHKEEKYAQVNAYGGLYQCYASTLDIMMAEFKLNV